MFISCYININHRLSSFQQHIYYFTVFVDGPPSVAYLGHLLQGLSPAAVWVSARAGFSSEVVTGEGLFPSFWGWQNSVPWDRGLQFPAVCWLAPAHVGLSPWQLPSSEQTAKPVRSKMEVTLLCNLITEVTPSTSAYCID